MKQCTKCKQEKPPDQFQKDRSRKDGLRPYCKACRKGESKNPVIQAYKQKWYEEHKELALEQSRNRYIEKKQEIKEYHRRYYKDHIEEHNLMAIQRYHEKKGDPAFRERRLLTQREWKKRNKHATAWRKLLENSLKKLKQTKISSTLSMLGYSADQLRIHIENLWTSGMSWENYGEWHIDHIKPISAFGKDSDVSLVNALSNLRPLWATSRTIDGVFCEGNLNRKRT